MTKYSYVLRTCNPDGTSQGGFQWSMHGPVACDDWDPKPHCGGGLHGFLNGVGDGYLADWDPQARWLVVRVEADSIVDLGSKVKFPEGYVVHCGDRESALEFLENIVGDQLPMIGAVRTSGSDGQSTSGYKGQSTSGDWGQSNSGKWGQSTSGDCGQSTSGYKGQSTSGYKGQSLSGYEGQSLSGECGQSLSGYGGQSLSGYRGQSTSRDRGQSTSGECGQSLSGDRGQSTSGDCGQSLSGYRGQSLSGDLGESFTRNGKVRAGVGGVLYISWVEGKQRDYLICKVGEMGTKPDTWYELSPCKTQFVECKVIG